MSVDVWQVWKSGLDMSGPVVGCVFASFVGFTSPSGDQLRQRCRHCGELDPLGPSSHDDDDDESSGSCTSGTS